VAIRGVATERGQQVSAQASLDKLLDERKSLSEERDKALANLDAKFEPEALKLDDLVLKPRKTDIEIDRVSLAWLPFRVDARGTVAPVYKLPTSAPDRQPPTPSNRHDRT
jgi:hypothetical protein